MNTAQELLDEGHDAQPEAPAPRVARPLARWQRRWRVGRAYDMAREIARYLPGTGQRVLDVGCGNGFVAHHLAGLLGTPASGCDLGQTAEAPIAYHRFDGRHLPYASSSFDVALLCYVLHHSSDPGELVAEVCRVLTPGGRLIVYEDLPETWFDRMLCRRHDRVWRTRGGAPSLQTTEAWRRLFERLGLRVLRFRTLSRWRDIDHPVSRALFVLERGPAHPAQRSALEIVGARLRAAERNGSE